MVKVKASILALCNILYIENMVLEKKFFDIPASICNCALSLKSNMYRNMLPVQFQMTNGNYGFNHFLLQLLPKTLHLHTHTHTWGADISTSSFKFNKE